MIVPKEIAGKLKNNYALLDTNIFIGGVEDPEAFEPLYSLLKEINCAPTHFSFIEFEFLRSAKKEVHRQKRLELMQKIQSRCMPFSSDTLISEATSIANQYAIAGHFGAEFIDCCIAALMKKYSHSGTLYLITMNHKDFPPLLFESVQILSLHSTTRWYHPGIYRFRLAVDINDSLSKLK